MIGTARSRVDFFMNKFSDFQFSVVFDVAAGQRSIMRPLRRSHFRLTRLTIIAEPRRPFEPTLSLFQFFYRRGCVVEGVDRRARQLGRFAFLLDDARIHLALNFLQKWKCIPGVRNSIYALVNCPVDLLCSPRCEFWRLERPCVSSCCTMTDFARNMIRPLSVAHSIRTSKGRTSSSGYASHFGDDIFVGFVFHRWTTPLSLTSAAASHTAARPAWRELHWPGARSAD